MDVNGAIAGVDVFFLSIPLLAMAELPIGLFKTLPAEGGVVDTSDYSLGKRDPIARMFLGLVLARKSAKSVEGEV